MYARIFGFNIKKGRAPIRVKVHTHQLSLLKVYKIKHKEQREEKGERK